MSETTASPRWAAAALFALGAAAGGWIVFRSGLAPSEDAPIRSSNLLQVDARPDAPPPSPELLPQPVALEQFAHARGAVPARARPTPPVSTRPGIPADLLAFERKKWNAVWFRYRARSEAVRAYEREWMATPELRALTESWHRDHDPAKFIRGLAAAKSFYPLLLKHLRDPQLLALATEQLQSASPKTMELAQAELNSDATMRKFVTGLGDATGLPLAAMAGEPSR